jgi:hypothetical protein
MAKKKQVTVTTEERTIPDAEIEVPAADVAGDDGLDGLLGLSSGGQRYTVHKEPGPGGKRPIYCATYAREELSLDTIRDSFGGGEYRITGFDSENKLTESKRVTIIDVPKARETAAPAAAPDGTSALLMQMIKSQGEMITALVGRPPAAAPSGPTAMELVSLIKALTPAPPEKGPVEMLLEGLKMGRDLGGGGDDSMMGLAKTALENLPALAAMGGKRPAPAAAPALPAPRAPGPMSNGNGAAAPPPQKTEAEMDIMKKLEWLKVQSAWLCGLASTKKDPDLYAEVFMDNLPPFITEEEIYERMSAENAIAQLAQLNPNVAKFPEWMQQFRQAVLDSYEPDETPAPRADIEPDAGDLEP